MNQDHKKFLISVIITSIITSSIFGGIVGYWAGTASTMEGSSLAELMKSGSLSKLSGDKKVVTIEQESAIINAVEKVSPSVVSIIITKDLPVIERFNDNSSGSDFFRRFFGDDIEIPQFRQRGTETQEIGGGTGFIITPDGYIVTNNHVVSDKSADYTVLMNDGKKYPAKVLARDQVNDFAVLKIEKTGLPTVEIGDSANLKAGQSVIAIGNALGEFRNTVSAGVISGLARSVVAGAVGGGSEQLIGVIQTDASINPGNSGGPLINVEGQVIGINTAVAQGAQGIGFAIPINEVKNSIDSVKASGRIIRPFLGVRYTLVDKAIAEENKLKVDYGALILKGEGPADLAIVPGSPANKAGLEENDIILEVNGVKISVDNPLANALNKYKPGEEVSLKVLHNGEEKEVKVRLEEMK